MRHVTALCMCVCCIVCVCNDYAQIMHIEGLHNAVRTYVSMIFQNLLVSFSTARYGEKQQKALELLIYFMERSEISSECVC